MKSLKSQSACALLKGWVVQSATTPATTFGSSSGTGAHRLQRLLQHSDQAPGAHFSSGLVSSAWWYPQLPTNDDPAMSPSEK